MTQSEGLDTAEGGVAFDVVLRGYDRKQVNAYISALNERVQREGEALRAAEERLAATGPAASTTTDPQEPAGERVGALVERVVEAARAEAEALLDAVRVEAEALMAEARADAEDIVARAHAEAEDLRGAHEHLLQDLARVHELLAGGPRHLAVVQPESEPEPEPEPGGGDAEGGDRTVSPLRMPASRRATAAK